MKTQETKRLFAPFLPAIFFSTILVFNTGCRKETTITDRSAIIYTDVNPDSVIVKQKSQKDSFKLDLNNDGIMDFEFDRSNTMICNDYLTGTLGYATNLSLKPANGSNAIMTNGSNMALALDSSKTIPPDSLWATIPQLLLYGAISASGHCQAPIRGYWINVADKYAGLKFSKNNQTYYGWVRLSCSYYRASPPARPLIIVGQLILKDYAYNSIPNQPIVAGQKR